MRWRHCTEISHLKQLKLKERWKFWWSQICTFPLKLAPCSNKMKWNVFSPSFSSIFVYFKTCFTVQGTSIFYYLFVLTTSHGMWDLCSQTRNWTCDPCIGSSVLTTRPHGKSPIFVYFIPALLIMLFEACRGLKYLCQLRKQPLGISKGNAKQIIVFQMFIEILKNKFNKNPPMLHGA